MDHAIVTKTALLLLASNVFMTFAWYGHLRFRSAPLSWVIAASWGIALFEYCLQVPANRLGATALTAPQLKILQEAITFAVFGVFSVVYLRQRPTLYDAAAMGLVFIAVAISMFQPSTSAK